jgi:hypothetical protein
MFKIRKGNPAMILRTSLILILLVTVSGCTSMTSTLLNRDDQDNFTRDGKIPAKGIPITLRVPTHLKVWIEEEYYIQKKKDGMDGLEVLQTGKPVISVVTSFDYEEKIFTVDFKRPGAGTLQTDIKIDKDSHYFTQIHSKIVDNTLQEITKVVKQFSAPLGIKTSVGATIKDNLIVDTRTVAFTRLDINACDFEQQLMSFFNQHINDCNSCHGFECPAPGITVENTSPQSKAPPQPADSDLIEIAPSRSSTNNDN